MVYFLLVLKLIWTFFPSNIDFTSCCFSNLKLINAEEKLKEIIFWVSSNYLTLWKFQLHSKNLIDYFWTIYFVLIFWSFLNIFQLKVYSVKLISNKFSMSKIFDKKLRIVNRKKFRKNRKIVLEQLFVLYFLIPNSKRTGLYIFSPNGSSVVTVSRQYWS